MTPEQLEAAGDLGEALTARYGEVIAGFESESYARVRAIIEDCGRDMPRTSYMLIAALPDREGLLDPPNIVAVVDVTGVGDEAYFARIVKLAGQHLALSVITTWLQGDTANYLRFSVQGRQRVTTTMIADLTEEGGKLKCGEFRLALEGEA